MDVLIIPEARREIEALMAFRPKPGAWGVLIGHKRGSRFIVEKVFPAGDGRSRPDMHSLAGLERIWPGRTIGLLAFRPDAAFRKAVLGPAWYGKLVLSISGAAEAPAIRPSVVEFGRKFIFIPVPLAPAPKVKKDE